MSRITKQIAEAVANQLVLPKRQEVQEQETKLKSIATEIYLKQIPNEVMDFFGRYPDFFDTTSNFQLREKGFNYEYFTLEREVPRDNNSYYASISDDDAKVLRFQKDKVNDLKKQLNQLKDEIEIAIFNLRTYNNVEKEFPEAFKLLPVKQTTALIVNLKDIRCKLDKANC